MCLSNNFPVKNIHSLSHFPRGSVIKNPLADAGDVGLIPGSGTSLGRGNCNPLQYSCWKISWTEEPGRLQSVGSQSRMLLSNHTHTHTHSPQGHRVRQRPSDWTIFEDYTLRTTALKLLSPLPKWMANPSNAKHISTFYPENFTDPGSQRKQWGQLTREPGGQSQGSTGADTAGPRRCPSGCYCQGPDFSGFYFYQEQMLYLDSTRRSGRNSSACKETPTKRL